MFAKKYESILFGFFLSGMMSFLVSGISTLRATGLVVDFINIWLGAWLVAWSIAFPAVLFAAPFTRGAVRRLIKQ